MTTDGHRLHISPTSALPMDLAFRRLLAAWLCFLALSASVLLSTPVVAESKFYGVASAEVTAPHIKVSLVSDRKSIAAGETLQLALRLMPDDGWHTYWKNPGDTGLPTKLIWDLPAGFRAGDIEWPVPERIDYQGATNFGYHGETWLLASLSVPANIDPAILSNGFINVVATAKWLICEDVCIPGKAELSLPLWLESSATNQVQAVDTPLADAAFATTELATTAIANIDWRPSFAQARSRVPELLYDISAQYAVDDNINIEIDANQLPAFTRLPEVFIGSKGISANHTIPSVRITDDNLLITAPKDQYLETPPHLLPIVLVISRQDDAISAIEFVAKQNQSLAAGVSAVNTEVSADKGLATQGSTPDARGANLSEGGSAAPGLLTVLLLALAGGIILNAMPCVFPVLSLKIVSLVESGSHDSAVRKQHGLAYTAGVVLSFMLVAAVLIGLRFAGEQVGWGFQLQSPWFIAFLIYLLFILGLSLSGFVEFGASLQNMGSGLGAKQMAANDWRGSFFTGVLATIVATPCTAPFMGTAMGFALGQSVLVALLVFAFMGLGLALPFLLIAYIPALANALPKPGNWMVQLKEFLAFPIYLTVVWLIWVFSHQTGSDAIVMILIGLVFLTLGLWIWRITMYRDSTLLPRILALACVVVALSAVMYAIAVDKPQTTVVDSSDQDGFTQAAYSSERLQQALDNNQPVFVNMTADWCITCKVNERVALGTDDVKQAFAGKDMVYLKGDWTNSDPLISEYLARFRRDGVPLYVYYPPGEEPKILPQILTSNIVIEAIR